MDIVTRKFDEYKEGRGYYLHNEGFYINSPRVVIPNVPGTGYYELSKFISDVVSTKEFRRLASIDALSFSNFYDPLFVVEGLPFANYSRLAHSFQVGYWARLFYTSGDKIRLFGNEPFGMSAFDDRDRASLIQLFDLCAVGHDIGHPNGGHVVEGIGGLTQEKMLREILTNSEGEIVHVLDKHNINPNEVADIVTGKDKNNLMTKLLTQAPWSLDTIAYVRNDLQFILTETARLSSPIGLRENMFQNLVQHTFYDYGELYVDLSMFEPKDPETLDGNLDQDSLFYHWIIRDIHDFYYGRTLLFSKIYNSPMNCKYASLFREVVETAIENDVLDPKDLYIKTPRQLDRILSAAGGDVEKRMDTMYDSNNGIFLAFDRPIKDEKMSEIKQIVFDRDKRFEAEEYIGGIINTNPVAGQKKFDNFRIKHWNGVMYNFPEFIEALPYLVVPGMVVSHIPKLDYKHKAEVTNRFRVFGKPGTDMSYIINRTRSFFGIDPKDILMEPIQIFGELAFDEHR